MEAIDTGLYWKLPGPSDFVQKIASAVTKSRGVVVNLPEMMVHGTRDGITEGLCHANIHHPISLIIRSGTDIASDVGVHFETRRITAAQLAAHHSQVESAVILHSMDVRSQELCEEYTKEFMTATQYTKGNVQLVSTIHNEELLKEGNATNIHLIPFDGGLLADEMDAYVALRMIKRHGPGSTRLLRTIVSEFAGFDAQFAERLMAMDNGQILHIREELRALMEEQPDRWRIDSWLQGTYSINGNAPHVLRDQYQATYGISEEARQARRRIDERYWRACLREITPWLEKNRRQVIAPFYSQLHQLGDPSVGNKISIPVGKRKERLVEAEEVEYNNIVGLSYEGKIIANNGIEQHALKSCKSAKAVRDDIAHGRAPSPEMIKELIVNIDACCV